jgi:Flp pilus assembly pilin Flp
MDKGEKCMSCLRKLSIVKKKSRQFGQGMSEYLIIVALIAVAAIGVVGFMGDTISNQMAAMAKEIAGEKGDSETILASTQAKAAATTAKKHKDLANYAKDNGQN